MFRKTKHYLIIWDIEVILFGNKKNIILKKTKEKYKLLYR